MTRWDNIYDAWQYENIIVVHDNRNEMKMIDYEYFYDTWWNENNKIKYF